MATSSNVAVEGHVGASGTPRRYRVQLRVRDGADFVVMVAEHDGGTFPLPLAVDEVLDLVTSLGTTVATASKNPVE